MKRLAARSLFALGTLYIFTAFSSLPVSGQASGDQSTAAVVNGEKITVGDWMKRMQNLRAQDFLLSANPVRFKPGTGGQIALEALISGKLLLQYAAKTSLTSQDSEVATMLANVRSRPEIARALQPGQFTEGQVREEFGHRV